MRYEALSLNSSGPASPLLYPLLVAMQVQFHSYEGHQTGSIEQEYTAPSSTLRPRWSHYTWWAGLRTNLTVILPSPFLRSRWPPPSSFACNGSNSPWYQLISVAFTVKIKGWQSLQKMNSSAFLIAWWKKASFFLFYSICLAIASKLPTCMTLLRWWKTMKPGNMEVAIFWRLLWETRGMRQTRLRQRRFIDFVWEELVEQNQQMIAKTK